MIGSNFNVAIAQDPNFIRLPISSNLWVNKNPSNAPINALLGTAPPIIGYDSNHVSNDLTDYIPFAPGNNTSNLLPGAKICADPTNNYIFQVNDPYNEIDQTYFPSGTNNAILTSNAATVYTWKGAASRQYKIVQYYATTYMPDSSTALTFESSNISPYCNSYSLCAVC